MVMKIKQTNTADPTEQESAVLSQATQLNRLLLNCEEYKDYCRATERLAKDDVGTARLLEFRRRQFLSGMAHLTGQATEKDVDELQQLFTEACSQPLVGEFLYAEGRFLALYDRVHESVFKDIKLNQEPDAKHNSDLALN